MNSRSEAPVATSEAPSESVSASVGVTTVEGGMTVTGEVLPGLWQGTATVASGNAREVYGIRVGWPQTVDGAVGAAMNITVADRCLPGVVESTAHELFPQLYTSKSANVALYDPAWIGYRKGIRDASRLNDDGVVMDANNPALPSTEERFYGGGVPQYGVYKVTAVDSDAQGLPQRVEVAVFMPLYSGSGTDTNMDGVVRSFLLYRHDLFWVDGDWKSDSGAMEAKSASPVTNPGWEWIHAQLGDGWAVPADGTQDPIPGAVLTR